MMVVDGVEMIDVHEAADLVHRTPETVRRWVWSGRVPAVKKGQKLFVPRRAVLAATGAELPNPDRPTLREWADSIVPSPDSTQRSSARDLVLDDRARR